MGSRHMLGAGRLGQLLCGRFLLPGPLVLPFGAAVFNSGGESMSFARAREKPLKRQALSASPVEHPRWVPGAEGEQVQIRKEDEWGCGGALEDLGQFSMAPSASYRFHPYLEERPT